MQEWEGSQRRIALRDLLVLALSLLPLTPCLGSLLAVGIEASLVSYHTMKLMAKREEQPIRQKFQQLAGCKPNAKIQG
ncbi:hypothetical protein HN51_047048 [Arachis hypogaea]